MKILFIADRSDTTNANFKEELIGELRRRTDKCEVISGAAVRGGEFLSFAHDTSKLICRGGDPPDIIHTFGPLGAFTSYYIRNCEELSRTCRRSRLIHTMLPGDETFTFPASELAPCGTLGSSLLFITDSGRIYPSVGAIIFCDRMILTGEEHIATLLRSEDDRALRRSSRRFCFKMRSISHDDTVSASNEYLELYTQTLH